MSKILTLEDTKYNDMADYALRTWNIQMHGSPPLDLKDRSRSGLETHAYINHSRWIAECPTTGCSGAGFITFKEDRCWCVHCNTGWHTIVFPDSDKVGEVEEILLKRPAPNSRNWEPVQRGRFPAEAIEDLIEQNKEHGIE